MITGGVAGDRNADLEREPVQLPGETNLKESLGAVVDADSNTLTIDVNELVAGTISAATVTEGGAEGVMRVATSQDADPAAGIRERAESLGFPRWME